jgi:hypothetical protein
MYFLGSEYVNIHRYFMRVRTFLLLASAFSLLGIGHAGDVFQRSDSALQNSINLYVLVDFNILAMMAEAFDFSWLLCGINVGIFLANYTESSLIKQYTL